MAMPVGLENAMLSIILNNVFTRNRRDMAAAEKARHDERVHQRVRPHKTEGDAHPHPAETAPVASKPEKG